MGCCIGGFEVEQTKLFTNCGWHAVNGVLAALFVCSPWSKAHECKGCCGYFLWVIFLPIRLVLMVILFLFGILIDFIATIIWLLTCCWCCGKCRDWGCQYCCETKKKLATDCIVEMCICECV